MSNNLKAMRKKRGLTQEDLAELMGTTKTTVYRHESGVRDPSAATVREYAKHLQCSPGEIMGETLVPLVGYIKGGDRFYPIDDHAQGAGLEMIPAPESCKDGIAVKLTGESMEPLEAGTVLFYDRHIEGVPEECLNKLCVVKLYDESMMLKVVKAGALPMHYTLISWNKDYDPIHDVRLLWAAKVKFIQQT